MVTAETAIAVPSILLLLVVLMWIILLVTANLQVVDAARAGARAAARGESFEQSAAVAEEAGPAGAEAVVGQTGEDVRVEVTAVIEPPGGLGFLPSFQVEAVAYAAAEQPAGGRGSGAREPVARDYGASNPGASDSGASDSGARGSGARDGGSGPP